MMLTPILAIMTLVPLLICIRQFLFYDSKYR